MNWIIKLVVVPIAELVAKKAFELIQYLIEEYKKDQALKKELKEIQTDDSAQNRAKRIDDIINRKL
jgi:hypothetical protein